MSESTLQPLAEYYAPGNDQLWCSDFTKKQQFCELIGLKWWHGDDHDAIILRVLRKLPHQMRWVLEMRTGIWCGSWYDDSNDWRTLGASIGIEPEPTEALFVAGVALFRAEAQSQHAPLLEQATRPIRMSSPRTIARPAERTRFLVLKRDSYRCQLCGATAESTSLEVDHKVPLARGGSNDPSNLWTLCHDCNRGKGVDAL